ncbi:hypothetical protein CAPTEDRAFT_175708 [Capitella teleta]|uniref:Delta(14)-sterol reductase n=1 Tax=Capitella teleta TaxID=283909 RepID=R7TC84_CAPTE|nr:hypothetical protein CAPTEDRAFT_175708 [Capitella teleta]|eukprot:ELT88706.1 hypothetical protein CAPTEDRAFT_175708 [Capitella teleta]
MTSKKKTQSYEFGGVPGACAMVCGLPLTVFGLNLICNSKSCSIFLIPDQLPPLSDFFNWTSVYIFFGWFAFQAVIAALPIGQVHLGLPLKNGQRLPYRCNAFIAFVLSVCGFFVLIYQGYDPSVVYENFLPLASIATVFSYVMSCYLYLRSHTVPENELAEGGNSGYIIYDYFIGRELNPRLGPWDLKFFCELRPGLIGWVMLDLCFCAEAYKQQGEVPAALALVTFFHAFYVADALWFEEAILTTMDIVHDGFGLMLAFGDLAWVPFLYCLQARFCLEHPQSWSTPALFVILLMHLVGYTIFRKSNSQKNQFRKNPDDVSVKHLQTLTTVSGRKLLTSGWWGMCRHPNYLGDLLMALSWSLPSGANLLPYFYPIYFLGLLVHRFSRDDHNCQKKYGADWVKYCKLVPYKIFPYIY